MSSCLLGRARRLITVAALLGALVAALGAVRAAASVTPQTISPNVQVNARAAGQIVQDFKAPSVAIDPADESNIVAATRFDSPSPLYNCQIWQSQDGGASWNAATFPPPPAGSCWAPGVAFDDTGHVYVVAQDRPTMGGGPQQIIVWASKDRGRTFAAPVVVPASALPLESFATQAGIAVDTNPASPHHGRIFVTWEATDATFQDLANLSFSDDHGATWSAKAERPTVPAGNAQEFPKPAVAADGTVYVAYRDTRTPGCNGIGFGPTATPTAPHDCPLRVLRSSDGGATFDLDVQAAAAHYTDVAASEAVGIAVTPGGTVLVTYAAVPDPANPGCSPDNDAVVVRSIDRGLTWSPPTKLSDDACDASQRDPWISVAPNGRVDAIFYDDRNDPDKADAQRLFDVYYANSTDDAASFGPSVRLTAVSFDASAIFTPIAAGFQTNEYDTFTGIASTNAIAVGAWGDPRDDTAQRGRSDVVSSVIGFVVPPAPPPGAATVPLAPPAASVPRRLARVRVERARVRGRRLEVLAHTTPAATGSLRFTFRAAGRARSFSQRIVRGRVLVSRRLSLRQARAGTGILSVSYAGSDRIRPETLRLRAASHPARLIRATARIADGVLQVSGTITRAASGVVRVRLAYDDGRGELVLVTYPSRIRRGSWRLARKLPAAAATAGGELSILYAGALRGRIAGAQIAAHVAP